MSKIEKDVPPQVKSTRWKYPHLDQMQPGDSVVDRDALRSADSKIYFAMRQVARKRGLRVSVRNIDGGVRIWLLSND